MTRRGVRGTHHIDRRAAAIVSADAGADDELLSTPELANWLGVSTQFLDIGRSKGYGPPFQKISPRMVRYRRGDVLAWLRSRTFGSTAEYGSRVRSK
jgi:predicted DNA-binding transcriptional regulator AlpA